MMTRLLSKLWLAIALADLALWLAVGVVRNRAIDWLGCSRAGFERGLIAVFAGAATVNHLVDRDSAGWHLLTLAVASMMWRMTRASGEERLQSLWSTPQTLWRLGCAALTAFTVAIVLLPPRRGTDGLIVASNLAFTAFLYCLAMGGGGERGRRAKLAAAKLKAMFGDSWQVAPLPEVS